MGLTEAAVALAVACITAGPAWGAWLAARRTREENSAQHGAASLAYARLEAKVEGVEDAVARVDGKVDVLRDDVRALQDWRAQAAADVIAFRRAAKG